MAQYRDVLFVFFFQAEDGIRDWSVTGVQTCALPIWQGFGLWSLVSKFTLAFAAAALLPILEANGFSAGDANSAEALTTLTYLYALVPCALKLIAVALLAATTLEEG